MNLGTKKLISWGIKFAIFVVLLTVIYHQIFSRKDIGDIWAIFTNALSYQSWSYVLVAILLVGVNWGLETWKWQQLMRKIEILSFKEAFKAILCGVTLALFTPNRVGEYGGRVLLLQKADKIQAVALTLVGSLSQMIANFSLGLLGLILFCLLNNYLNISIYLTFLIAIVALIAALFTYFHLEWLPKLGQHFSYLKKINYYIHPTTTYTHSELRHFLFLSSARYVVFAFQYLLLLWAFGIEVNIFKGLVMITSIYFVQTMIPSIAIVEMGVRGNVALFFMGYLTSNDLGVLATTFTLWSINLLLPALGGMLVLLRVDLPLKQS